MRLVRVCKQIYAETRLLVFSSNVLKGRLDNIIDFLEVLDSNQMSAVKVVQIEAGSNLCYNDGCITGNPHVDAEYMLEQLEKLRSLEKVLLNFCCPDLYQPILHENIHVMAMEEIEKAVCSNGRTVEVELMLNRYPIGYYGEFNY